MLIRIDFNSDEPLYVQLKNQIIMGIANAEIGEGESLPSVRELADSIGINMHTVNKAYSILRQEGYIKLDRRHGDVIWVEQDKQGAISETESTLREIVARAVCKDITRNEIHDMVNRIYDEFMSDND